MAWFSFHGGHSGSFCRHAKGTLVQVVEAALDAGFTTYGLSEHGPRDRGQDLYAGEEDLGPDKLGVLFREYTARARALQERYAGRIELLVGFETEVVPRETYVERMRELRAEGGFDFMVGSVHHVAERAIDFTPEEQAEVERDVGGRDAFDRAYFVELTGMIRSLEPEIVGHFDLARRYRGDDVTFADDTWPLIEAALVAAREAGSALDVNASPVRRGFGPVYPGPEILALARRLDVAVTLGDDSHGPDSVGSGLEASVTAIRAAGYEEIVCLRRMGKRVEPERVPIDEVGPAV